MSPSPEQRYPSAEALAEAVTDFISGRHLALAAEKLTGEAVGYERAAAQKRAEAQGLQREAGALLGSLPASAPEADKAAGWGLDDRAQALVREAELDDLRVVQTARSALEKMPDWADAHRLLAARYRVEHERAEASGDRGQAERMELLLRHHDRGEHAAYLRGVGTLRLGTSLPVAVRVAAVEMVNRRLVCGPFRGLGTSPLDVELPKGSYVLTLGSDRAIYPILLEREGLWDGDGLLVPTLAPGEVWVPEGPALIGGDPDAAGSLPGARIHIDGFVMQRDPVSVGAYLDFLNGLIDAGDEAAALRHAPHETGDGAQAALVYPRDSGGRFVASESTRVRPVAHVDWHGAVAYADWMAQRTGQPWRLPSELEWEKAARGVDGRFYPWGDFFDPSRACVVESHPDAPVVPAPGDYPVDESVYGVRGLAGGVRDWCLEPFRPEGPTVREGRLLIEHTEGDELPRITRGGAFSLPAWVARPAVRGYHPPIRLADLGFRLVRPVPAEATPR